MLPLYLTVSHNGLRINRLQNTVVDETQESTNSVFLLPEDVLSKQILPFLTFREVVRLDSALVNRKLRKHFRDFICETLLLGSVEFRYVRWCQERRCFAKTLRVTSDLTKSRLDGSLHFEELMIFTTAKVSKRSLVRLLTNGNLRSLNIRYFCTMRLQPPDVHLSLLEINASDNRSLQEDTLVNLVKCCPHLQTINAMGCKNISERLTLALAEHCPNLLEVHLTIDASVPESDDELPHTGYCELFKHCRQVRVFECTGDFTITNLQTLADCFTGLVSIQLQSIYSLDDDAHTDLVIYSLVKNNIGLHTLKLTAVRCLGELSLLAMAIYLRELHTLILINCKCPISELSTIRSHCTNLKTFEVYYQRLSPFVDAQPIDYFDLVFSFITTLTIHTTTLTDEQFIYIAQTNPNMQKLNIVSHQRTSGSVLSSDALCEGFRYLCNLEVFDAELSIYPQNKALRLEDFVLLALVQHCPKLIVVDISGHANLSNDAIAGLARLPVLKTLIVNYCINLSDDGICIIAEHCPQLRTICLSSCAHITGVSINALAQHCRRLAIVQFQNCEQLQNNDIRNFIRRTQYLQTLDLTQNPQLTFSAVAELPKYCLYMIDLRLYGTVLKPVKVEFYASYQRYRRYFDIVFGWSKELENNRRVFHPILGFS